MKKILLPYQSECIKLWQENKFKGIAHVVTGAGKTILAIGAIETLIGTLRGKPLSVKIIVPKTFLMYQWQAALCEQLNIARSDIGFFSGTQKAPNMRRYAEIIIMYW